MSFHCFYIFVKRLSGESQRAMVQTYALVPGVPELRDANVEANAERERASEDGGHVNTCKSRPVRNKGDMGKRVAKA